MNAHARLDLIESVAPHIVEPVVVPTIFLTGLMLDGMHSEVVRIVAWDRTLGSDGITEERRIVARLAMSQAVARLLLDHLRKEFARGGN